MKLNVKKIKELKKAQNLTYDEIAERMGLNSKQHVYDYIANERVTGAEKFAKVFGIDPIELIAF